MTSRAPTSNGFTLIEMLVTLAIAGLIAGLAFPAIERAMQHVHFAQTASRLILAVRKAAAEAVSEGRRVSLQAADGNLPEQLDGHQEQLAPGTTVIMQPRAIAFFSDGSTSGGTIVLRTGDRRFTVRIDAATGSIVTQAR